MTDSVAVRIESFVPFTGKSDPFERGGPATLPHTCGLRVNGLDLAAPLSANEIAVIRQALLEHHVVVFPGQNLSREQQFAFAARFGEVAPPAAHRPGPKRHGVAHVLSNLDAAGNPEIRLSPAANYHWHTDKPYWSAPPAITMLHAIDVPPEGGDTEFANTAGAYDALPRAVKHRIAGLRVAFRPAFDPDAPAVDHPLVRTHPETGRKALYLGNHATHIAGLPEAESRALLADLLRHATEPRFVYRHRWRVGDLVVWDNRCLLHRLVLSDALRRHRRILYRSIVKGTVPV